MQDIMHVDVGIPMTNHLIFIVFLTIPKNLEYFENFDNFEVCLSSGITLSKNYLQHEVRVKTVHRSKLPKMLKNTVLFALYSLL